MIEQPTVKTIVSFLLDRTGSMESIKTETIGGFNAYLDILERDVGDLVEFTLLQFDSEAIETLYLGARLSEVSRLTPETYQPRAYTPLIDACFSTIKATEEVVARRKEKPRVIVVFQTDGFENASTEHSIDELRDLIARRKTDDWRFVFLGANIDAYSIASSFGIAEEATLSYSGECSVGVLREIAAFTADFARGDGVDEVRFTAAQKRAAGDQDVRADQRSKL